MAIVGRAKYTRARESPRRRDAKGAPKLETTDKRKTLIGPFLDICRQSGNSRQAAVNTHDNIDSVSVYWDGRQIRYRVVSTNSEVYSKLYSVRLKIVCPSHSKSC